jgi:hypothetical protein
MFMPYSLLKKTRTGNGRIKIFVSLANVMEQRSQSQVQEELLPFVTSCELEEATPVLPPSPIERENLNGSLLGLEEVSLQGDFVFAGLAALCQKPLGVVSRHPFSPSTTL